MLERILEGCDKLFRKFGIKSLGMDDIARELGMSKKTIYQYVSDKNDLVKKTFSYILTNQQARCTAIKEETKNPVEEIVLFTREISQQMMGVNPSIFFDLRKYHPDAWLLFSEYSNDFVYNHIKENLYQGKEEAYYRPDFNEDIIARIYISMLEIITDPDRFHAINYEFSPVYLEMISYHLHGICTTKGYNYFKNKIS